MTAMSSWTTPIPAEPTPKLVQVSNIAADATEDKVREFFLFCGKINQFEMKKDATTQSALIMFDKESAAKTATMLSNAVIADTQIQVRYYFDSVSQSAETDEAAAADSLTAASGSQEAKPKTGVVSEIIKAGHSLSTIIVTRAMEFDAKYGVSAHLQPYYEQALAHLNTFEEKYHIKRTITDKATELDQKYGIRENVTGLATTVQATVGGAASTMQATVGGAASTVQATVGGVSAQVQDYATQMQGVAQGYATQVQGMASNVLASGPGQTATGLYQQAMEQVGHVWEQGRHMVGETMGAGAAAGTAAAATTAPAAAAAPEPEKTEKS